ncbi:secretory pathway Sec39 [Thermothelomyces heterothallicus CBS 203.75]
MALSLSPAKLVLLAVHCTVHGDVDSLTALAAGHGAVLKKDLLLRILLTFLPETLPSSRYTDFVRQLESGLFPDTVPVEVDCSPVEHLAEDDAVKKVRRLRLLPLALPDAPESASEDAFTLFLLRRSYKVDEEAGLLDELPALLLPFMDHSPCVRTLLVSTILPLLRRNCEYYPQEPIPFTLHSFQHLPDRVAVSSLLSRTGSHDADISLAGRDLRGLVAPWLSGEKRWKQGTHGADSSRSAAEADDDLCPGWDEVLRWLMTKASKSWRVAVSAIQQWDGPGDADLGGWGSVEFSDSQREYLEESYARAALASAYLIPEASLEALDGAYTIAARVANLRALDPVSPLASALAVLPPLTEQISDDILSLKNTAQMRNDLLSPSNPLTSPTDSSLAFLQALALSAHILTKAGCPCTIRRAGELALLRDEREQKAEAAKLIYAIGSTGPKTDDRFWIKARNEILWLRDWGAEDGWSPEEAACGVFGQVKKDFLEVEILKALLSNTRYTLARSIYEDAPDQPLDRGLLQDTIYATAMTAYDNASNPNRTRGGLKKCDEIIKAFPKTIQQSDPRAKRIEALLQATHSLSGYRLVLKQGEPFTPVVLRVHADPVSIISKILEQNPRSYTQLHDLLSLGTHMVNAGLTTKTPLTSEKDVARHRLSTERRITAMCINAALAEDDFETAYSYVVNRIAPATTPSSSSSSSDSSSSSSSSNATWGDDYSWKAALQAGKYRRGHRSSSSSTTTTTTTTTHHQRTLPSGVGSGGLFSSANADVRHLEQRIECLATALRVAPPHTLQEIVNAFRRAEEELEVLVREEQEREAEWDARGDQLGSGATTTLPGVFGRPSPASASAAAAAGDEDAAPMSLFDLSRASVLSAQRNLSALSALHRSTGLGARLASGTGGGGGGGGGGDAGDGRSSMDMPPLSATGSTTSAGSADEEKRVRKRDQLREAAMGTLVSGVGWLVGAPPPSQLRD